MDLISPPTVRTANLRDSEAIAAIYNHYILNTIVTFEETPVSGEQIGSRINVSQSASLPYLVVETEARVIGYAYAGKWKGRCAYRHSVEISIYLDPAETGNGIGTLLYRELFDRLKELGSIHTVIGGVALPNPASIALHEKLGMEKVAHFKEVGFKFEKWIDVGYWQKTL